VLVLMNGVSLLECIKDLLVNRIYCADACPIKLIICYKLTFVDLLTIELS